MAALVIVTAAIALIDYYPFIRAMSRWLKLCSDPMESRQTRNRHHYESLRIGKMPDPMAYCAALSGPSTDSCSGSGFMFDVNVTHET